MNVIRNTPCWYKGAPSALGTFALLFLVVALAGCKPAPPPAISSKLATLTQQFPTRPTTPPPPFKLTHQTDTSITLVTDEHATDDQITAILYQLHDAAQAHTFDQLKIPQKLVDARDPFIHIHIYRGPKCAAEKYADGPLPCGNSYHAAGDYTLGDFTNKQKDSALLRHPDTNAPETPLWDPSNPLASKESTH